MSNPLQIIASIHNDHSKTNHEKQSLLQAIIQPDLNQPDKDVLSFVLQLTTATNEDLSAAMQALEHYSPLFIDIVQSPHLVAFLSWLRSLHSDTSSSRILSSALTMIKLSWRLNIEHRAIPSEHVSAITALSLTILSSESLALAEQASRLLEVVLSRGANLDLLSQLYDCVRAQASHPSATTLRYLSLGASLCKTNDDVARDCVGRGGLVARAFEICRSNDLLLAINALSLLTQFSESGAGLEELCRETVLDWLITAGCGNQRTNQAPDPLLEAEVLRVLADVFIQAAKSSHEFVAQISGECIESFLSRVHDYLDEGNEEHKITALGLLADFSMISSQTLSLLQTYRSGALLSLWLRLLNSSKTELSAAALSALVRLFDQSDDLYVTNSLPATNAPNSVFALPSANAASEEQIAAEKEKICSIKRALFQRIGEVKGGGVTSLHYLVKAAKQPVSSLRLAAVDLLRSLAQQRTGWGIRELFNQGYEVAQCEFWLYLRDRTTEFSKEGKDFKFALVEAVWQSSYRHLLGEEVNAQLQAMISQGAYYMPPRLQEMETL